MTHCFGNFYSKLGWQPAMTCCFDNLEEKEKKCPPKSYEKWANPPPLMENSIKNGFIEPFP